MTNSESFSWGSPELAEHLVHFVSRTRPHANLPPDIEGMGARQRLESILRERLIRANDTFYSHGAPVVCFTEATHQNITWAVESRGYEPWGLIFSKGSIWANGGAPVLYVREDEQSLINEMPAALRSRTVKIDPLAGRSWMHEREWRITYDEPGDGFRFNTDDIAAVIVGDSNWSPSEMDLEFDPITADWEPVATPSPWSLGFPHVWWAGDRFKVLE